jgi:hypothetical protein
MPCVELVTLVFWFSAFVFAAVQWFGSRCVDVM